jgi:hypothetical protein
MIGAINSNPYYLQTKSFLPKQQTGYANLDAPKNVSFGNNLQVIFKKGKSFGEVISSIKLLLKDWQVGEYGLHTEGSTRIVSKKILANIPLIERKSKKTKTGSIQKTLFLNGRIKYSILEHKQSLADIHIINTGEELYIPFFTNTLGRNKYRGLEKSLLQIVIEDSLNKGVLKNIIGDAAEIGNNTTSRTGIYKKLGAQIQLSSGCRFLQSASYSKEKCLESLKNLAKKDKLIFPETKANLEKLCYNKNA